jgi:hypothetical protein
MSPPPIARLHRAFGWGGVMIMDGDSSDVPTAPDEMGVARSGAGVCFPVRHAQDVETPKDLPPDEPIPPFEVNVDLFFGAAERPPTFVHRMSVPSGRISVGDADEEELIEVPPGRVDVSVWLSEIPHAEHVEVWIQAG